MKIKLLSLALLGLISLPILSSAETPPTKAEMEARRKELETRREEMKKELEARKNEIDAKKEEMKDKRETIKNEIESKREAIKGEVKERKEMAADKIKERVENFINKIEERFNSAIERLEKLSSRIESRITKLESEGKDTTEAKKLLETAKTKIVIAKESISKIDLTNLSDSSTKEEIKTKFDALKPQIENTKTLTTEAHSALVDVIKNLKPGQSAENATE